MPATKKDKAGSVAHMIIDPGVPFDHRRRLLGHLCHDEANEQSAAVLGAILDAAAAANGEALENKKVKELAEVLKALQDGPLRDAVYVETVERNGSVRRAQVVLQDGTYAYPVVPDADLGTALRCGDRVLLDAECRAVLFRNPCGFRTGEEARLERRLGADLVEVVLREHERVVVQASAVLLDKLEAGDVTPGAWVLACPRRGLAFDAVPRPDGYSHYRFLVKEAPPDVLTNRDIGAPPAFIEEIAAHVRMEMTRPQLGRRYRRRRSVMKLLTGVSGSGKTLSIQATWRRVYEIMSETTGTPLDRLPPRVLKLRMSQVLSKWLGDSDKHIDRFFDEAEQLADELFEGGDGNLHELPVIVIGEECDGLARARGGDAIYDRIQTTLLQRLDTTCQNLKGKLIVYLFTTNIPEVVDPAFLRRAGGTTERFGRLNKRAFVAVLAKHLRDLPFRTQEGREEADVRRQAIADVTAWLFSPNADRGQVELTYVGSTTPVTKYRKDFLTGALVDRAVQQAADAACRAEDRGSEQPGLTGGQLLEAFEQQIRSIAEQLHVHNAGNYLTLPDGVRVGQVRRLEASAALPHQLERAT